MSADQAAPAAERQIARIVLAGERDYVGAALAFIHELAERVGLAWPTSPGSSAPPKRCAST